ncbi:MAG: TRZ/ATZ family hydrolase [Betaproteobacteria bacterium]|nr:TRZ/ATZ family hydrolase [Gammaproteobacteria bacterium]MDH3438356.1 TRZ/ATZ family hydrolase [Betaproteobacteria bacterium]
MEFVDTLVEAGWIIPVEPDEIVLEDHALAIRDGRIVAILPQAEANRRFEAESRVALPGHTIIPGLVNAHTHAAMSLFRGLADDLPLMSWLNDHIWPAEQKWVSDTFVRDGTRLAVAEMIRSGTTCFNDMYFYPDEAAKVASEAGMRVVVGLIVLDFSSVWASSADEYITKGFEVHDQFRNDPLVTTAFAPHAPYTVSDEPLERVRTYADELDIPVHMHVHETVGEVADSVAKTGERPLARLQRLGLLSNRLLAVHLTQLEEGEIEKLAALGVSAAHCPESNLKLASGFCPVARLDRVGVNVCIGTDGAASNNDLGMLAELRTAALLAKGVSGDASAIPAHSALRMATLNGAKALGLDAEIGSLEPGKAADMVAVDLTQLETQPVHHPVSQVVYAAGRHQISDVWINGHWVLKGRQLVTLDTQQILRESRDWAERLAGA